MSKRTARRGQVTIGLDLGDRWTRRCVLDAQGRPLCADRLRTTPRALTAALRGNRGARMVLEVGPHSPWVSRLLQRLGGEVIVANPRRVKLIAQGDRKSDRVDAETLARLGRADPALLAPIAHRGEEAQKDLAQLRVRAGLVRSRARLIQQARGIAKALGVRLPSATTSAFARRVREAGHVELFPGFGELLEAVDRLTRSIRRLEREAEQRARRRYPETALLRQVSGVGPITSLAYVLTLEDPRRFGRSREVGAYLGLCPRQRESGAARPELGISKRGDPFLRRLLVQGAQYILGPFGPDTTLRRFGLRLAGTGGKRAKNRAVVAVARKLAVLLHRLWVTAEVYEPLRGAQAAGVSNRASAFWRSALADGMV